jgi:cytidine deaminase
VKKFKKVAVVADTDSLTPPCGACRQILWEFCGDVPVVLANLHGKTETLRLGTLFPRAFDASFL